MDKKQLDPRRWQALFLLCAAQFIVILDTSIIGIALPAIQKALGFSPAGLQWVFNAYVIAFGGLLLLGGRLGDLRGARGVFITGFAVLAAGSVLAGSAWSAGSLIFGRAMQGIGAAFIAPAALMLVMSSFTDPKELSRALGFWGASAAAGGSAGVFLGGIITQWLDWRWAFFINVPVAIAVVAVSPVVLRKAARRSGQLDVASALLGTAALVLTVYAIVGGEGGAGRGGMALLLGIAAVLFGAFIALQRRRAQPLVPLQIFSSPNVAAGNAVMALLGAAWIPGWFFLNLYLQEVQGRSPIQGGLALLPMTIAIMVLMVTMTARMVNRFGFKRNLVGGLLLLAGSLVMFAMAPTEGSFAVHVLPASLLAALGMALAYVPATIAGMSGARAEESGLASGLINTSYQIGSALGLAAMVAVSSAKAASASTAGVPAAGALNVGFQAAFGGAAVIAAGAALVAAFSVRAPRQAEDDQSIPLRAA